MAREGEKGAKGTYFYVEGRGGNRGESWLLALMGRWSP